MFISHNIRAMLPSCLHSYLDALMFRRGTDSFSQGEEPRENDWKGGGGKFSAHPLRLSPLNLANRVVFNLPLESVCNGAGPPIGSFQSFFFPVKARPFLLKGCILIGLAIFCAAWRDSDWLAFEILICTLSWWILGYFIVDIWMCCDWSESNNSDNLFNVRLQSSKKNDLNFLTSFLNL